MKIMFSRSLIMSSNNSRRSIVEDHVEEKCTLIDSDFGTGLQIALGVMALSILIFKRFTEVPRRPCKIWSFDASKQAIGAVIAHTANLCIAIFLHESASGSLTSADECAFYFVNFTIDTTVGLILNWFLLYLLSCIASRLRWTYLAEPGFYGNPIRITIWLAQLCSWLVIILLTKIILGLVIWHLQEPLGKCAEWLFEPLRNQPRAELLVVMIACPCIMNAAQFWIQDNFLKRKKPELKYAARDSGGKAQLEENQKILSDKQPSSSEDIDEMNTETTVSGDEQEIEIELTSI